MCKECFFLAFETEIHDTIVNGKLFKPGDKVAIGASGGKDSTVLAYVLKTLNERYKYGLDLFLLSIDEGITGNITIKIKLSMKLLVAYTKYNFLLKCFILGYRDDSLKTVMQNRDDYDIPLKILSYKELYGWTMDSIVAEVKYVKSKLSIKLTKNLNGLVVTRQFKDLSTK